MTIPVEKAHATIDDIWPDRASYTPGEAASVYVALHGDLDARVQIRLRVWLLDQEITGQVVAVAVRPGATELRLPVTVPRQAFRGYGVDVELLDLEGAPVAHAGTALDVLDDWTQAPRYGFLSDFAPGQPSAAAGVHALARYHVNVVQFYDWMWRHYELMPPDVEYTDGMGRPLSLEIVRAKVAACRAEGMATMGYAAVYGAEPEYALEHPDEMLYDASGTPWSLEQLFYIMNVHAGNPWRARILKEMARAVREVPFDGLHLDQYGFPKEDAYGPGPDPERYDLAQDFPPFVDDARQAIREARPGSRAIFNAVGNWPVEAVAPTTQDATYIEVWPPFDGYGDLQTLIGEARRLAPDKQVILAAYLTPLQGASDADLPSAESATRLASAAIWANGGFHLLMGETGAALCDPYYPRYARLRPDFARIMRRYYDFVVRYENVLCDRRLVTMTGEAAVDAAEIRDHAHAPLPAPGGIWTIVRSMPGIRAVSLINLAGAPDLLWNAPKPPALPLRELAVSLHTGPGAIGVFVADPDSPDQRPRRLPFTTRGEGISTCIEFVVPQLDYWTLVVVRMDEA